MNGSVDRTGDKPSPGRYSMTLVSDEEAAQVGLLKYVLAQGCKGKLVEHPEEWPSVHSVHAL